MVLSAPLPFILRAKINFPLRSTQVFPVWFLTVVHKPTLFFCCGSRSVVCNRGPTPRCWQT